MPEPLYKSTGLNGACRYGNGTWRPYKWRTAKPPLKPCRHGIHYCTRDQLVYWLGPELWLFEDGGDSIPHPNSTPKMVTTRGRITEPLPWTLETAVLFAADCAEHVLPQFESRHPDDDRPRKAIEVARAVIRGEARAAEAAGAAWAAGAAEAARAAWAAGAAGAAGAARAAGAAEAAWAARAAGWAAEAAEAAEAAWAARAAGWAAEAAEAAGWAAEAARAAGAAGAAEAAWQTDRLFAYPEGRAEGTGTAVGTSSS